jgi:hypothetical protein
MTTSNEQARTPDVDRLARSMLLLTGHDDDDDHGHPEARPSTGNWSKAPDFGSDPQRAAAVQEATARDKERYLTSGLASVDCRFCHATVAVKKLGPEHTTVQWNSQAAKRCAVFDEIRSAGGDPARAKSCHRLTDSIRHAIAEGCLEEVSSAPSPGDG